MTNVPFAIQDSIGAALDNTYLNPAGSFVASTRYYVYCYANTSAGPMQYEISTTGPDVWNIFKTGDTTRRYLFTFVTDVSSMIIPFLKRGSQYRYFGPQSVLVNGSVSNAWTAVNLAAFIPPFAQIVLIGGELNNTAVDVAKYAFINPHGLTGFNFAPLVGDENRTASSMFWCIPASQQIDYRLPFPAGATLTLDVWGWI
jgi:hypothetical protein